MPVMGTKPLRGVPDSRSRRGTVNIILDGGSGAVLATGLWRPIHFPFAAIITEIRLEANVSGSIVIDLYQCRDDERPAVASQSICAADKPTLSSSQRTTNTQLQGWNNTINKDDWLYPN